MRVPEPVNRTWIEAHQSIFLILAKGAEITFINQEKNPPS